MYRFILYLLNQSYGNEMLTYPLRVNAALVRFRSCDDHPYWLSFKSETGSYLIM